MGDYERMISMRVFIVLALVAFMVFAEQPALDGVVPEEVLTNVDKHTLEGPLDDDSDHAKGNWWYPDRNLNDKNSDGLNKLTGSSKYESNTLKANGEVAKPYVHTDAHLSKDGHYYLGASRRRIGAGYGRRRRTPKPIIPKKDKKKEKKAEKKLVKKLEAIPKADPYTPKLPEPKKKENKKVAKAKNFVKKLLEPKKEEE